MFPFKQVSELVESELLGASWPAFGNQHAPFLRPAELAPVGDKFAWNVYLAVAVLGCVWWCAGSAYGQARGQITLEFREKDTGLPFTTRVKILSADGREQRVRGALYQQGWNLFEQPLTYVGRVGDYTYRAVHGPQFSAASGGFTLDRQSEAHDVVELPRHADLQQEGWLAGDLLSHIAAEESLRWLAAEDLMMAAVFPRGPTQNDPTPASQPDAEGQPSSSGKWVEELNYWDDRAGSGLVLHHWQPPAEVPSHVPSSRLLVMAKQAPAAAGQLPVHAEIQRPWARDVPIWLASGHIDTIQILGSHLTIDGERATPVEPLVEPEAGRFKGALRSGRLVEYLYWQMLECGLEIPPSAGSGFGRNGSPLGYNRVVAYAPDGTASAWWQAVRAGHSFVTNGPLLRVWVNGELPGKRFEIPQGGTLPLEIAVQLTVADPVEYLDVVFNGRTLYRAPLDEFARAGGVIPPQEIRESGWLVIRVVTRQEQTYRLASTAPYYVQVGGQPRISAAAVAFFQSWLEQSARQIAALEPEAANSAEPYLIAARKFWTQRASQSTVP
jgi:hypothetical protein